jgi:hypothetical protein
LNSITTSQFPISGEKTKRQHTAVIQVFTGLPIAVPTSSDVKITLDLVEVETPVDATAVNRALDPGCLGPLSLPLAQRNNIVDMLLAETFVVAQILPPCASIQTALAIVAELMHALAVDPLRPAGAVFLQLRSGEDTVARSVLDVDVKVIALHLHDDIEVDLQVMRNALLHREVVSLVSLPPPRRLGPKEHNGEEDHGHRPLAAARRLRDILRFRFSYDKVSIFPKHAEQRCKGALVRTKGIESAHNIPFGPKVVLAEAGLFEAVHGCGQVSHGLPTATQLSADAMRRRVL